MFLRPSSRARRRSLEWSASWSSRWTTSLLLLLVGRRSDCCGVGLSNFSGDKFEPQWRCASRASQFFRRDVVMVDCDTPPATLDHWA